MFLHRQATRRNAARPRPLAAGPAASANRDIGNVAIIEDSDGVVETLNQFDLDRPHADFHAGIGRGTLSVRLLGRAATIPTPPVRGGPVVALGDDDSRTFTLPFAFPFYGATYTQVFLNSDGNLTFNSAESASTSRSVGRMTGGPPRISPLFDDLDPSQTAAACGSSRMRTTWSSVGSAWRTIETGVPQTFQVRLYADGGIQFSYAGVNPISAVVGIAPGSAQPGTSVVSFHNDQSARISRRGGGALRQHAGNRYRHGGAEVLRDPRGCLRLPGDLQQHAASAPARPRWLTRRRCVRAPAGTACSRRTTARSTGPRRVCEA